MTDKELRKLSRLELLELLLDAAKENERLREELIKLRAENKTAQNIENLSAATGHIESALKYANSLTDSLKTTSGNAAFADVPRTEECNGKGNNPVAADGNLSDKEIYRRMLNFFIRNDEKLSIFPQDTEDAVRYRIKSILEKRNIK